MAGTGGVNMEKFEEYFQRADLDRDGRISGAEAVSFLQGSNLPRQVLAQIWAYADQNRTGFLTRPEFYNALKLVTVAQSRRELTPDIVKAALYGDASARIPPPQINTAATPLPQPNPAAASPLPQQMSATTQPSPQNFGFRGPTPSTSTANQQFGTVQSNIGMAQQFRPMPSSTGMNQPLAVAPSSSGPNSHFTQLQPATTMNQHFRQVQPTSTSMNRPVGQLQLPNQGMNQQFGQAPSSTNMNQIRPPLSMSTTAASHPSRIATNPNVSGPIPAPGLPNSNKDGFGGKSSPASTGPITQNNLVKGPSSSVSPVASKNLQDILSAFSTTAAKNPKGSVSSGNGPTLDMFSANQSSSWKVSSAPQQHAISLPTSSATVPVNSISHPPAKPDPFEALQSTLVKPSTGTQAAQTSSLPNSTHQTPTQVTSSVLSAGVQAGVGNSTAEQPQAPWPKMTRAGIQKYARVFMEVDADRDGKITGHQAHDLFLSWRLPREVLKQVWDLSDQDNDSKLSLREFCIALYLMERYREGRPLPSALPNSVMLDETLLSLAGPPTPYGSMGWTPPSGVRAQQGFGANPVLPAGLRPPMQPVVSQSDGSMQFNQRSAGDPKIDNSHANQLRNGEASFLDKKEQEAAITNELVDNKEKIILDSREKLEFYRTKMQDLVLYKSRCDNRLNEITERARADKNEAELLEKKYQEKYKQVGEIHSKLTIEEAAFREIQARKTELQQAIIKMEQGGSADGILQVRADRIQSDLEELTKALTDRCKKHGLEIKSAALIELPPGWQPGIPEIADIWDEDWDKFDDEGFSFDVTVPENAKSQSDQREKSSSTHSISLDLASNAATAEKLFASAFDAESVYSADESKSPRGSPGRQTTNESPSQEYSENHFRKNFGDDAEESHRSFDEPAWGNFDNSDDIDSVWGFNAKEDHGKNEEKYFFGSNDVGASPDSNGSPHSDNAFQKNSPFNFEESVSGSPPPRADNSPRYSAESRDPFFDSFSRYDSFSTHDRVSSSRRESFSRFDSMNSTRGSDHRSNYSFDDNDPFGSSGPFKVSSSETPPREKF